MDEVKAELRAIGERLERIERSVATHADCLDRIERSAVTRSDVFQAVAIVQSAWLGVIVGTVVVLAAVGAI